MHTFRIAERPGIIEAQAPCRADLAGGTMDLWPLYMFHPGALTLNFAVNILTSCRITSLKGRGFIFGPSILAGKSTLLDSKNCERPVVFACPSKRA